MTLHDRIREKLEYIADEHAFFPASDEKFNQCVTDILQIIRDELLKKKNIEWTFHKADKDGNIIEYDMSKQQKEGYNQAIKEMEEKCGVKSVNKK